LEGSQAVSLRRPSPINVSESRQAVAFDRHEKSTNWLKITGATAEIEQQEPNSESLCGVKKKRAALVVSAARFLRLALGFP
jgi:hypothetical protein